MVDSLKIGNETLKQINEVMSIEDIEKILDETQEAVEKQQVILNHHTLRFSSSMGRLFRVFALLLIISQ